MPAIKLGFHISEKSQTILDFAVPDCPRFCLYVGKIADHRRNLGEWKRSRENRYAPDFPNNCPRPSQMIGDSCFYKSAKSGTVGEQQNPRSSGIFSTYKNQA